MSTGLILIGGLSSICASLSCTGSFYACTDGTFDPDNFSSNNCTAFFQSNCYKIDTQETCDDKDTCQWDQYANPAMCIGAKDTLTPEPIAYPQGKYVQLKQTVAYDADDTDNANKIINIAEVEVYDENDTLISAGKTVTGSSVHDDHGYAHLVDGNKKNFAHTMGVTETEYDSIKIDLGATKKIKKIVVTNRKDCCQDRINGVKLEILDNTGENVKTSPTINVAAGTTAHNAYTLTFPANTWSGTSSPMDFVTIGDALKCTAATNPRASEDADNTSVYRYTAEKTIRFYPDATIAASWDADWATHHTDIDCTGFTKGADMAAKPAT